MNWWKRWKNRHWEKRWIPDPPGGPFVVEGYEETPLFRSVLERVWRDLVTHRWLAFSIIAAIIAALIARP